MALSSLSHVVGIDDSPFPRSHRGDVLVVGAVYSGLRLEGVLTSRVRRDGANAARKLARMIGESKFAKQLQLVLLQGIALGGFNVIDLDDLHSRLELPLLVVARRAPRLDLIRAALLSRVRGGERKWALIERLEEMEPLAGVYVQRVGIPHEDAERVIHRLAVHSRIPEPLRAAHLIAGGVTTGESRGRP